MARLPGSLMSEVYGSILVVPLHHRYPDDDTVEQLWAEIKELLRCPDVLYLTLDFALVQSFDANLRGMLVRLARELRIRGGRLAVCNLGYMSDHLHQVRFDEIMILAEDREQAIAALLES